MKKIEDAKLSYIAWQEQKKSSFIKKAKEKNLKDKESENEEREKAMRKKEADKVSIVDFHLTCMIVCLEAGANMQIRKAEFLLEKNCLPNFHFSSLGPSFVIQHITEAWFYLLYTLPP